MILKDTKLQNELKKIVKQNPTIIDINLFGSVVKGKEKPNDIDIMVIFKEKINKKLEYEIKKILEKDYKNISIISKTTKNILEASFDARESILFEGISLISKKNLAERYGFISYGMFKYDFKTWTKLQKTKFYYALNGRGKNEGILNKLKGIKLADNAILINLENIERFREFLESWKLKYKYIPTIIPKRLGRKNILEN